MKKGFIIGGLIFLVIILAIFLLVPLNFTGNIILSVENVTDTEYLVNIENFAYNPYELIIQAGETVKWVNLDTAQHTVTSDNGGELNSLLLEKGDSYFYTFEAAGEYPYHCVPHPYMIGKIIVE